MLRLHLGYPFQNGCSLKWTLAPDFPEVLNECYRSFYFLNVWQCCECKTIIHCYRIRAWYVSTRNTKVVSEGNCVPLFPCSHGENRLSALHCQVFSTLLHEPQKRYRFLIGVPRVLKSHITVTFTGGLKAVSDKVSYRVQQKNYCVVIVYIPR